MIPGIVASAQPVAGTPAPAETYETVRIASGVVSSDVSDLIVFVGLQDLSSAFWNAVASDGGDIRVETAAGVEIPFDLAHFDHFSRVGRLYFRAPSVLAASNNDFRILYGTGLALLGAADPNGRLDCWSGWSVVVDGRQDLNRASSATAGTLGGNAVFSGGAIELQGTDDYYRIAATSGAISSWSAIAMAQIDTADASNRAIFSLGPNPWSGSTTRVSVAHRGTTDKLGGWNTTNGWMDSSGAVDSDSDPLFVAYTHVVSGTRELFNNGASVASGASAANLPSAGASGIEMDVGVADSGLTEDFTGRHWLFGRHDAVLSAAYIAALAKNWRQAHAFYDVVENTTDDTPQIRDSAFYANATGDPLVVNIPAGSQAGDAMYVLVGASWAITLPAGYTSLKSEDGTNWNGEIGYKVLEAADITAGTITIDFAGSHGSYIALVTMVGNPTLKTIVTHRRGAGATTHGIAGMTPENAAKHDLAVYFTSGRGNTSSITCTRETIANAAALAAASASTNGSGRCWSEDLSTGGVGGGVIAPVFTYGASITGSYDALLVFTADTASTTIEYVGGKVVQLPETLSNHTISLTDLAGGLATQPADGDLVLLGHAIGNNAAGDINMDVVTAGYTKDQDLYMDDLYDGHFGLSYKRMGASPDTEVTVIHQQTADRGGTVAIQVWRGVDATTPLDVASTVQQTTSDGLPDPEAISPVTRGAVVCVFGMNTSSAVFTCPTLNNFLSEVSTPATINCAIGAGWALPLVAPYNPPAFGGSSGDVRAAVTLALRPAA